MNSRRHTVFNDHKQPIGAIYFDHLSIRGVAVRGASSDDIETVLEVFDNLLMASKARPEADVVRLPRRLRVV